MLKAVVFAVIWLHCAAVLQVPAVSDEDYDFMRNFGTDIKSECAAFLLKFAKATKEFNMCAVEHAKPLRFCEKCAYKYTIVLEHNPVKFNDSNCVMDLVRSERFQLVMKVFDFQTELWQAARCQKCYIGADRSGDLDQWNQTKLTQKFFHWLPLVHHCFKNYTEQPTESLVLGGNISNHSVCIECRHYYFKLRATYRKILLDTFEEDENLICADIMSAMNDTRKDWKEFGCWSNNDKNYTDLLLSFGILLFTIVFYFGVQKHEKYKTRVYSSHHIMRKEVNYDSE